jgi:hypothetical protein
MQVDRELRTDPRAEVLRQALLVTVSGYSPGLVELFSDDVLASSPVMTVHGRDELAAELRKRDQVFSQVEMTYRPAPLGNDGVFAEWTIAATQSGRLALGDLVVPPSTRRVSLSGATVARFLGSQIREFRQYWDVLGLLEELGLPPAQLLRQAVL